MATESATQRILAITSMIVSGLVLLLTLAGIIVAWNMRSAVIELSSGVLDGVDQLAQIGRNNITRLDSRLAQLETAMGEIESAVEQVGQNVEDKGLVMTLLPPEKEQHLENLTQQITDGLATIKEVINATRELKQAIDRIPFINLPELEPAKMTATEEAITSLRNGVTDLKNNIRQFREEAVAEISEISTATENVGNRLASARENLAQIDSWLGALQTGAAQLKQTIPIYVNILVVILTLVLVWVGYGMVVLIQRALVQLQG